MTSKEELRSVCQCLTDDYICLICDPRQYLESAGLHPCERKNLRKRVKYGHRILKAGASIDEVKKIILGASIPMSEIDEETDEEDVTKILPCGCLFGRFNSYCLLCDPRTYITKGMSHKKEKLEKKSERGRELLEKGIHINDVWDIINQEFEGKPPEN